MNNAIQDSDMVMFDPSKFEPPIINKADKIVVSSIPNDEFFVDLSVDYGQEVERLTIYRYEQSI